jgi:hypothetical protein
MALNKTEFREVIHAPPEAVWEVLVAQYGDIHVHNPTMQASNWMDGATEGVVGAARHCQFTDKIWLDEHIAQLEVNRSVTVVASEHNLPFMRQMRATYELMPLEGGRTELKMSSYASTFPGFMIYLMRGQLAASLAKHLFGMKVFIETGETVSMDDYDGVFEGYVNAPVSAAS